MSTPLVEVSPEEAQAVLCRAAELIEERGWTQGEWTARNGAMCVSQAITEAAYEKTMGEGSLRGFNRSLMAKQLLRTRTHRSAIAWNDMKSRKKEEVIAKLRGEGC